MYATIVERKLRSVFAALNRGDYATMVASLAPAFTYRFEGDSPIGGLRTSKETMASWWQRLYRLFPGFAFEVQEVTVSGPPWNTRIHVLMDFVVPHHPGGPYRNVVMQSMRMKWGKVHYVHTLEDTLRCSRFLAWRQSACDEAIAAPLTDQAWPEAGPFMRGPLAQQQLANPA